MVVEAQAKKYIDEYIDMACFKHPDIARQYLIDGFMHGYKFARKVTNS